MVQSNLKRLPVIDEQGKLIGMLSRVDVLHSLVNVPTVQEDTSLEDIVARMVTGALRRVIVIDPAGRPVGLITDGDLVARVAPKQRSGAVTARDLMSEGVLSGPPETSLATAVGQMLERQTKRFVVVDDEG
jgi:CBS domain-containing protein